ncbi:hypothetical protein [Agreia sp. COWG]|uniref:hypothetical protein n=1 Tax=Agreia sp. COWG TaxID=2773266 RepID=UPI001926835C|nr:hypothetical protein [Agreia sp. COWG]CAD5990443.1 membrane protein of unknown function [Agreia sp. COWG]
MPRQRRSTAWAVLAAGLIAVGALLAPVGVVASWADAELTSTDRFVEAFTPLATAPAVQKLVVSQTSQVIDEQLDLDAIANDAIDNLGTGPLASAALKALSGSAVGGLSDVIDSGITGFVSSEAFVDAWRQTLRSSHSEVMAALSGDPQAALAFGTDGSIGVQLGPIVAQVRQSLVDQGLSFASLIPEVDRTVVVGQSDLLPTIQSGYRFVTAAGPWLPWLALALLVAGVLAARRRSLALLVAGIALSLGMVLTLVVVALARSVAVSSIDQNLLPADLVGTVYDALTADMRVTALVALVVGVVAAAAGWVSGPSARAGSFRSWSSAQANRMRRASDAASPPSAAPPA